MCSSDLAYAPTLADRVPADAMGFAAFRDLGPTLLAAAQDPQAKDLVAAIEQQTGVTLPGLAGALAGEHTVYATTSGATLLTQPQDASGANMILSNALVAARGLAKDAGKPPFWHATSTKCRPHRSRT